MYFGVTEFSQMDGLVLKLPLSFGTRSFAVTLRRIELLSYSSSFKSACSSSLVCDEMSP